jgi:hypothetical protein
LPGDRVRPDGGGRVRQSQQPGDRRARAAAAAAGVIARYSAAAKYHRDPRCEPCSRLTTTFYDYGHTRPLVIFAQRLTTAKILLLPLVSGAALLLAISGRVRHAIMALGAVMLVEWAHDLPSLAIHGLPSGLITLAQTFIYPVIAAAAIWLAARGRLLGLAVAFVAVLTVEFWAGAIAFAIAVSIYGF